MEATSYFANFFLKGQSQYENLSTIDLKALGTRRSVSGYEVESWKGSTDCPQRIPTELITKAIMRPINGDRGIDYLTVQYKVTCFDKDLFQLCETGSGTFVFCASKNIEVLPKLEDNGQIKNDGSVIPDLDHIINNMHVTSDGVELNFEQKMQRFIRHGILSDSKYYIDLGIGPIDILKL